MATWHHVTVGVADLDTALDTWINHLGFEVRATREGADEGLAALWGIEAADIARQALVATPTLDVGLIHLVQFNDPEPPVREGAEVFDMLPKNLDIHARDLPARVEELKAKGMKFRNDTPSDVVAPNGTRFREIHMFGHDATNIVMIEVVGEELPFNAKGFAGVGPLICIVPDAQQEEDFYVAVLGLDQKSKNLLTGPEIERMVGLPPGSGLDVRVLGKPHDEFGLIEIVDYQGVEGEDRYGRAKPKALGTLHISYFVDDLGPLEERLAARGVSVTRHGMSETLFGKGQAISFRSPAGLRIEAHEGKPR